MAAERENLSNSQQIIVPLFTALSTTSAKLSVGLAHTPHVVLPTFFLSPHFSNP